MKYKVHMLAFNKKGSIKEVNVPDDDVVRSKSIVDVAEKVYCYGQNQFLPRRVKTDFPSVSMGDVIEIEGRYFDVVTNGVYELDVEYFNKLEGKRVQRRDIVR